MTNGSIFDQVISRRGTGSFKWDYEPFADLQPMWVADMDFAAPPPVLAALHELTDHGVFGYAVPPQGLNETVVKRLADLYGWEINPQWLVWLPGLVFAINVATRTFAKEGEGVATYTPAYPPYLDAPGFANRESVRVPLSRNAADTRYEMNPADLAAACDERTRVLLLCHPHNPTGRVFTADEIRAVAEVCDEKDLLILSDEIHCDLLLNHPHAPRHIPTASLSPEIAARTITLLAPSKTFNLPGLACGMAVISDPQIRRSFQRGMRGIMAEVGNFGYAGCLAAYRHGESWRQELLTYLRGNAETVQKFVQDELPGLRMDTVEATYLAWLDCREAGLADPAAFFAKVGVGLSDGAYFGTPGFVRLNFGCPRSLLMSGLEKMRSAFG